MKKFIKEPLLHFLVVGLLLFAASYIFNHRKSEAPTEQLSNEIVVDSNILKKILLQYQHDNDTTAPPKQIDQLVTNYINDEMLYREALKVGMDKKDDNVRTLLINQMKVEYTSADKLGKPSEDTLKSFYKNNPREFGYLAARDGALPPYDQVRDVIESDYLHKQQEQLDKQKLDALQKQYRVIKTYEKP